MDMISKDSSSSYDALDLLSHLLQSGSFTVSCLLELGLEAMLDNSKVVLISANHRVEDSLAKFIQNADSDQK